MPLALLQPWLDRWRLTPDGAAFSTRFGSHLIPVIRDGEPAMLKVAGGEEERRGAALMAWYGGDGAAAVLAHEGEAILLERAMGARSLADMARGGCDDEATRILCETAACLHQPRAAAAPTTLIPLPIWFRALAPAGARHGGTFGKADHAARELLAAPRDVVVLHGDLHHENLLDGGARGWLVIDPKGLIGERGFEYANLFRNPDIDIALAPGRMSRQVDIVAERAGLDRTRLLTWILAYAGLGAAWSLSSGGDPQPGLAITELAAAQLGREA
jgi:streptomycin 6-kinase